MQTPVRGSDWVPNLGQIPGFEGLSGQVQNPAAALAEDYASRETQLVDHLRGDGLIAAAADVSIFNRR